jgi:hypothetical protein
MSFRDVRSQEPQFHLICDFRQHVDAALDPLSVMCAGGRDRPTVRLERHPDENSE